MAEAGPSHSRADASTPGQAEAKESSQRHGPSKTEKPLVQGKGNIRGRQANANKKPRSKPRHEHLLGDGASGTKPKGQVSSKPRGRQSQRGMLGETSHGTPTDLPTAAAESKADMPGIATASDPETRKQRGKENPHIPKKYDNQSRIHSNRNQRFRNYSKSKTEYSKKLGSESNGSTAVPLDSSATWSSQSSGHVVMDTQKSFSSHGIVSDGIYVPKNRLGDSGLNSQKKANDNVAIRSQVDVQTNSHSSKRVDYSYHVGGLSKHGSHNMGNLTSSFQAVSVRKQGQSSVQAGVLIDQLTDEKYECMVCCEVIRCAKAVWSCSNCFHIFHLYCIKRWARSPAAAIEGK